MTVERDPRISGYLDGELDDQERREFEADLERSPELARELESIRRTTAITESMTFTAFPDRVWDGYWEDTYRQLERRVGWVFISVGATILVAAWLIQVMPVFVEWLLNGTSPWYARVGAAFLALGGAVLIVSVLRERVFKLRRDPYRKVRR